MAKVANGTGGEKQPFQKFSVKVLEDNIVHLNEIIQKTEREWAQMVIKLKRERMVALAALSRSKLMLAEMELFIAENELNHFSENSCKKIKLADNEEDSNKNSKQNTRRHVPSRRRNISLNVGARNVPSTNTSDSVRNQSSSFSRNENSPSNHINSSTDSTSSVTSLRMLKSTSSSPNINTHLTDSIIAEFEKPYQNVDLKNNINKLNKSNPKGSSHKQSQVNLNSVSNVELSTKLYPHESLSYRSHLMCVPDSGNMTPFLLPKDPRNNSILQSKSPIRLAVPPLKENINTYVPNEAPNSLLVPTPTQAGYFPLTPIIPKYKSISTFALHYKQTLPTTLNQGDRQEFKFNCSTQPLENGHMPISIPQMRPENLSK